MVSQETILEMLKRSKRVRAHHKALMEKLKDIPHLRLPITFAIDRVMDELRVIDRWVPHQLSEKRAPQKYREFHGQSFKGRSLVDMTGDSLKGMEDIDGNPWDIEGVELDNYRIKYKETEIGRRMPYTLGLLKKVSPYINRTRAICTPPGGGIVWHSHHNNAYKYEDLSRCAVVLTVTSNASVVHRVRNFSNKEAVVFEKNYEPGTAWLFNSWHDHEFWNHGKEDRIAIISYFDFTDTDLLNYLRPLVEKYDGPFVK